MSSPFASAAFAGLEPRGPSAGGEPWQVFAGWAMGSPEFGALYARYLRDGALLWQRALEREQGRPAEPVVTPDAADKRFAAPEWSSNALYDFLKQSYLIQARFMTAAVEAANIDAHAKGQLRFLVRQYVDALAPSNFAATNPDALKAALATNGETFRRGVQNLIADMGRGRIATVDESAFEVGRNLATTPGAVIFENELFQLIQYAPLAKRVHARPLLMVPPCINKFYVLDLSPDNSFVRYALGEGHAVYMVSWRNPQAGESGFTWDDYIERGVLTAIATVRAASGARELNALGFCVGGTLLTTALAVLAARGRNPVASLTLLATLLDFSDAGEIGCFVNEASVAQREAGLARGGLLSGHELAAVFSALRDNDLIWSYVVNNYLKGARPAAFDILYWNADSTNLPGPMFTWYLRHMYLENALRKPGALTVCGERVDLSRIDLPAYVLATKEDHIVPWKSAFESVKLLGKRARFVLGASGHIAGIVNPASKHRRSFWRREGRAADAAQWLAGATEVPGSWWSDWSAWLAEHGGGRKPAPRALGNERFEPIEPAPGRYVKVRI